MSVPWYMSFTFNPPVPIDCNPIIYLYFETTSATNGAITFWKNIDIGGNCQPIGNNLNTAGLGYFESSTGYFTGSNYPNITGQIIGMPSNRVSFRLDASNSNLIIDRAPLKIDKGKYVFQNEPFNTCCFSEGTKILCYTQLENSLICILKEEYRLVQHLKIGDLVKSYLHGYRKVSKIIKGKFVNNPKDEGVSNCMYRMIRTKDNGLIEDLTLTRNHGVLVEKLSKNEEKKIDKDNLPVIDNLLSIITADCDKFEKVMDTNNYKYYHFSLDGDGDNDRRFGVWANGLLVEVPSNNMLDGALNTKPLDF